MCLLFLWDSVVFTLGHQECSQLPTVEHAFVPSDYKKSEYLVGDVIYFSCDRGYISALTTTYICTEHGWTAATIGQCIEISCVLPVPNSKVHIFRVPAGSRITVQCVDGGRTEQMECLPSGQWGSTFPTCSSTCDVGSVPDSVLADPQNAVHLPKGQSLQFHCKDKSHVLHGQQQVTCSENRQWNHPFPSCTDPRHCGPPPSLENGDFIARTSQFHHNARVEYQCKSKYVMQGGPYKTCLSGEWTGDITCLKPCTVNPDLMQPNKIRFRYSSFDKLYAQHNEAIAFACIRGATPDGSADMRRICNDGTIVLPRCV